MSQIKIPSGNDFVLELICMRQVDTETKDAFDISTCTNVSLNLYDETREDYVQLNSWALAEGTTNVIRANVEGTALQPQTKYGLVITGVDENGENFKTRIRGRNFIYVVGSISDVSANDFITNPLTIQVTMNIQGELKPVNFDDFATVEIVDEKIAAAIESIDLSDYATKNQLNQTNEALSAESRTRSSVDQTLQSAVEAVGTNLSSNYYTKTQVDDIVSSITGTGGDVTKEYVDNAVSGVNATIQDIDDRYLVVSKYKDIPLTFHNPRNKAVKLGFGNFGVNTDSFGNEAYDGMTQWSIQIGDQTYTNICSSHENQGDSNFLIVEIPAGEKAEVYGIIENTHGWLSFVSNGELTVEGNLGSIFNDRFKSFSKDNHDRMFMHIENPQFYWDENHTQPIEVLQVKDFSHVYCDYTNYQYMNQQLIYGETDFDFFRPFSYMREMFKNNEYVERSPIFINYGTRFSNNDPYTTDVFIGCVNLVEFTDLSIAPWHGNLFEPNEEYKCWTEGLTINLPEGCADIDKRYYQHMPKPSDDMVTINYIKSDLLTPYEFNGIQYALIDQFRKKSATRDDVGNVQSAVDDINNNKLSGLTNKNTTQWESTDYGFTLMDVDVFSGHPDMTEGLNVEYNNTCYISEHTPDWMGQADMFAGLYNSEHIRMQFEMGPSGFWLGNPDEVGDWEVYGLQEIEETYSFLNFDKTNDCQKAHSESDNINYRFGWPTTNSEDQYEELITTIKLDDCNHVGQAWRDAGITEIRIYGNYLNSIFLNDQDATDAYCKYHFRIEHDGSTDQHIYLATDSRFVYSRCVDWKSSEYTIDRTTTNITGDLNVSGNIIYNGDKNIETEINSIYNTISGAVSGLATEAYVDDAIAAITGPDLSEYATQQFVNEAVSGLATEAYVDAAVSGAGGGVSQQYVDDAVSGCLVDAKSYTDDAISSLESDIPYEELPYEEQYLTIECVNPPSNYYTKYTVTINFWNLGYNDAAYSFDRSTWTVLTPTGDNTITMGIGNNKFYLKANKTGRTGTSSPAITTYSNYNYKVYGNILSMVYGDDFKNKRLNDSDINLDGLFSRWTHLVSAKNLILPKVEQAAMYAYGKMFLGCKALVEGPEELHMRSLGFYDYGYMFYECSSLTTAPKIIGKYNCGNNMFIAMFNGCSSLTFVYTEFTGGLGSNKSTNWLNNVGANGILVVDDNYSGTIPDGNDGLPTGWTLLHTSNYNYTTMLDVDEAIKPLLYNIEQISAANSTITLTLNANEYNKVYLVDYAAETPEYVTGDTTITLTGTADYNVSILKFKTDANFNSLTLHNQSSAALKWIGDDFTALEANKEYEVMFEYTNGFELIVSWAEVSAATVNP